MLTAIIATILSAAAPVRDTIPLSPMDTSCSTLPPFTGVYNDPFAPPMTREEFDAYVKEGWELVMVPRFYEHVQVEVGSLASGQSEWRCGTLPSGIALIVSPDKTYARLCYTQGRVRATDQTTPATSDDSDDFFLDKPRKR